MQIDQNIIDEVTSRANLVDVIGKHLKLKRSGTNFFACCPFHKEKSPSFSINTVKQYFHCFGCDESGDAITFTMKYHGLDFIDAVKSLAAEYNIHIPESNTKLTKKQIQEQKQHKLTLAETISKTVKYYQQNLPNNQIAFNYLVKRGISSTMVNKFALGFAPNSTYNNHNSSNISLSNMPLAQIFPDYTHNQFLIDAGLVIKTEQNKFYDRFRDRIMFPIKNVRGEVIGFGGRIIQTGEPKYLNSPETILFNKSQELYGLFEAQKSIRTANSVIIVEGYMDVIALSQFEVNNVVATMGTAATDEHIKKLFRLCDKIYYCFDGDDAGRKAAWRALTRSIPLITDSKHAYFTFLPSSHDPDSFIREYGKEGFTNYTADEATTLPLSKFLLEQLKLEVNITTNEGKAKLISLAKPFIEQITATASQVMLKLDLANTVNLTPQVLESILNNRSKYAFYNNQNSYNNQNGQFNKFNKNTHLSQIAPTIKLGNLTINTLQRLVVHALLNIAWVNKYQIPHSIDKYSPEIQELIFLLDFIHNNYNNDDTITLTQLKQHLDLTHIDLDAIHDVYNKKISANISTQDTKKYQQVIDMAEDEFCQTLDKLFGINKTKAIKIPNLSIPKVPIRNNN
jgi:DNA primase